MGHLPRMRAALATWILAVRSGVRPPRRWVKSKRVESSGCPTRVPSTGDESNSGTTAVSHLGGEAAPASQGIPTKVFETTRSERFSASSAAPSNAVCIPDSNSASRGSSGHPRPSGCVDQATPARRDQAFPGEGSYSSRVTNPCYHYISLPNRDGFWFHNEGPTRQKPAHPETPGCQRPLKRVLGDLDTPPDGAEVPCQSLPLPPCCSVHAPSQYHVLAASVKCPLHFATDRHGRIKRGNAIKIAAANRFMPAS